jgi:phosphatidylserine decarboxylase
MNYSDRPSFKKGDEMGGFQLGSTVVLVFEAPLDGFEFNVQQGQKVRVGQAIGSVIQ